MVNVPKWMLGVKKWMLEVKKLILEMKKSPSKGVQRLLTHPLVGVVSPTNMIGQRVVKKGSYSIKNDYYVIKTTATGL